MAGAFITGLLTKIDTTTTIFVSAAYSSLGSAMSPVMTTMVICLIAFTGYRMWYGNQSVTLSDSVWTITKVALIYVIASSWPLFQGWAYDLITNGPAAVGGNLIDAVSPGETLGGLDTKLAQVWTDGMSTAGVAWRMTGVFTPALVALTIIITTVLACGYMLFLLCLGKIAVGVLTAIGPIMIAMLMFDQTKGLFEGWLRTLLSFSFIPALAYAVLAFFITMLNNQTANLAALSASGKIALTDVIPLMGMSLVLLLVLSQVREWSAGISGGVALQTRSLVSQMTRSITRNASRNLWRGSKAAGKAAGAGARAAGGAAMNRVRQWRSAGPSGSGSSTGRSSVSPANTPRLAAPQSQGRLAYANPRDSSGAFRQPSPATPLQITHVKALPKPNSPGRGPGGTKA